MTLIIKSELVGEVGEEFVPPEGTNVEALIAGGFIEDTTTKVSKEK